MSNRGKKERVSNRGKKERVSNRGKKETVSDRALTDELICAISSVGYLIGSGEESMSGMLSSLMCI